MGRISEKVRVIIEKAIPLRNQGLKTREIISILGINYHTYQHYTNSKNIEKYCPDLLDDFVGSSYGGPMADKVRDIVGKVIKIRSEKIVSSEKLHEEVGANKAVLFKYISTVSILKNCPDLYDEFCRVRDENFSKLRGEVHKAEVVESPWVKNTAVGVAMLVNGSTVEQLYDYFKTVKPCLAVTWAKNAMKRAFKKPGKYRDLIISIRAGESPPWCPPHECLSYTRVHVGRTRKDKKCSICGLEFRPGFLTVFRQKTFCRRCMCGDDYFPLEEILSRAQVNNANSQEVYNGYF